MMKAQVGIDLGTTNSVASYMNHGKIEYIKFRNKESIQSVAMYQNGKFIVGDKAKKKANLYPENYIKSSKTYMGDISKTWNIEGREFSATDIAKEILLEIKSAIGKTISNTTEIEVVITVPAYFTSSQIDETKKAGEAAGLIVKQIITEPVSAAIAYGFEDDINQKIFIVDIGGGTFDTAILEVKNQVFNTLSIGGYNNLGGDDFDLKILNILLNYVRKNEGVNLSSLSKSGLDNETYSKVYQSLLHKAEEAKVELSEHNKVEVSIANLFDNYNLELTITRLEFEESADDILYKIKKEINTTLEDANLNPNEINKVVLVGGSSRIPAIRDFIIDIFNTTPYSDKPLDKLVAIGAAIAATDENTVQINDIISHSLGIEIVNERFSPILIKNSKYPVSLAKTYTTTDDYQEIVNISVYEGEDDSINNNKLYGGFELSDLEFAEKGVPQIEVTFEFDKNRILHVAARDLNTNSTNKQTIEINKG
ncbi:Hsp70 family protein [Candidatus Woesearchaeota archaeon]|jgi:molecular chaperone DnaK|nr:Hsp70 family protein [Campylobacteraceae bacterium]MBT4731793.1 Hsp70 family protein [Candidatus Woesearchaeota archaeon]